MDYFVKQLLDVSFSLVLSSAHSRVRSRALACLARARQGTIANQLHAVFNDFMRKLKTRLEAEGVAEFWEMVLEKAGEGSSLGNVDFGSFTLEFETQLGLPIHLSGCRKKNLFSKFLTALSVCLLLVHIIYFIILYIICLWVWFNDEISDLICTDLISTNEVSTSDVDPAQSKSIYETKSSDSPSKDKPEAEDDDDLFDMM